MITVIRRLDTPHQNQQCNAILKGLKSLGVSATYQTNPFLKPKTKRVACWGWRLGKQLRQAGHDVLVMEHGYIGDRFKHTSLCWNGLNGHGRFAEYDIDDGKRFSEHGGVIRPWRSGGDYALIMGQLAGDMSLNGRYMAPVYDEWARRILNAEKGLKVHLRNHPVAIKKRVSYRIKNASESPAPSLKEALDGALFSICLNSNSSVDSVLNGTPCITMDRGSMAYDVCGHDIGHIVRPKREIWAYALAFKQFTQAEIESGWPLKKLLEMA